MSSAKRSVDIGIFIALEEEFRSFRDLSQDVDWTHETDQETGEIYYLGRKTFGQRTYSLVASFADQMGGERASSFTERMLARYSIGMLCVLGIAGSVSDSARLCDVVVANATEAYLASSKIVTGASANGNVGEQFAPENFKAFEPARYEFKLAGEGYRPSFNIRNAFSHLRYIAAQQISQWEDEGRREVAGSCEALDAGCIRDAPSIVLGAVASGPSVVSSEEFAAEVLLNHNRKYVAIEMESAAVIAAATERKKSIDAVVLRGISDLADARKARFDAQGGGVFRKVAMRNAVRLLWCALEADVLGPPAMNSSAQPQSSPQYLTTGLESELPCCKTTRRSLQIQSVHDVIRAFQDFYDFRWEPIDVTGAPPLIFWPVRLRPPTPIHAVQTFAAAALSQNGARVLLCLDDLGNTDHSPTEFTRTLDGWWKRSKGRGQFQRVRFSELLDNPSAQGVDPWPIIQRWLGETNEFLDRALQLAKAINPDEDANATADALRRRRPRRILSPAVVWTCLALAAKRFAATAIITLGGHDERALWNTWHLQHSSAFSTFELGHLYIPILGETPLHMSKVKLDWRSAHDIQQSLLDEIQHNSDEWFVSGRMVAWCLNGCVSLPDFAASNCTTAVEYKVDTANSAQVVVRELVRALDTRLLGSY